VNGRHVATALLLSVLARAASAAVPVPTVTGPITGPGTPFVASTFFDVTQLGYVEEEFFLAGTATAFTSAAPLGSDGEWTASPAGITAAYNTRILVRRPADPKAFSGTVFVEWLNVSGGLDAAPDWIFAHTWMMREGHAWVGVSAQRVGIEGGGGLGINLSLKTVNPARYGGLVHPGDSFSYDMYSQVAAALRGGSPAPLGGLEPRRIIAIGESQSAFRLVTYVNAIHPLAGMYGGYFIHSRGGGSAQLSQSPQPVVNTPPTVFIREDVDVPVLTFQTETDLVNLGFLPARQLDTPRIRLWEVAGTAHADAYQSGLGFTDLGPAPLDITYAPSTSEPVPGIIVCNAPVNQGPQQYVVIAALAALDRWVRGGRAPRRMPRLELEGGVYVTDEHGNVVGGVRTPQLDVPIATYSGLGQTGIAFCFLFGTTVKFDGADLAFLYGSHDRYVALVKRAARRAVRRGAVLALDAKAIIAAAEASSIAE
jgi:hypothetical protein